MSPLEVVAFVVRFAQVGLLAQVGLQIVFIGLSLVGWYWWLRGGERGTGVRVSRPGPAVLLACLAAPRS